MTRAQDQAAIEKLLKQQQAVSGAPLIGLFPGAGHPSRRWPLECFAELADYLFRNDAVKTILFAGPEEHGLLAEIKKLFPPSTVVCDRLTIPQLAAAQARLAAFVSNDTGPMHIAAAVGTPTVVLIALEYPHAYVPLAATQRLIFNPNLAAIEVDEVYAAVRELLASGRTARLFAS